MGPPLDKVLLWRSMKNDMDRKNIHKEVGHGLSLALGGDEDSDLMGGHIYREEPRPNRIAGGNSFMEVPLMKAFTLMGTDTGERVYDLPRTELRDALSDIMRHLKGMTARATHLKRRSMLHMKPWNERT